MGGPVRERKSFFFHKVRDLNTEPWIRYRSLFFFLNKIFGLFVSTTNGNHLTEKKKRCLLFNNLITNWRIQR